MICLYFSVCRSSAMMSRMKSEGVSVSIIICNHEAIGERADRQPLSALIWGYREHVARCIRHAAGLPVNTSNTRTASITVGTGPEHWLEKCQPERAECSRS